MTAVRTVVSVDADGEVGAVQRRVRPACVDVVDAGGTGRNATDHERQAGGRRRAVRRRQRTAAAAAAADGVRRGPRPGLLGPGGTRVRAAGPRGSVDRRHSRAAVPGRQLIDRQHGRRAVMPCHIRTPSFNQTTRSRRLA